MVSAHFSSVREAIGIFQVDVETKERPRKIPFFLTFDSGGHHSTRGE